jgi:hypothetical protein
MNPLAQVRTLDDVLDFSLSLRFYSSPCMSSVHPEYSCFPHLHLPSALPGLSVSLFLLSHLFPKRELGDLFKNVNQIE